MKQENMVVTVRSDKKGNVILEWPDLKIFMTLENTENLIDGLKRAVEFEEGLLKEKPPEE